MSSVQTGLEWREQDRLIHLQGCLNFRDLGGYRTVDGRWVKTRCLFRSAELCHLTEPDLARIKELGIKVVVDLRNEPERKARPGRVLPGVEVVCRTTPAVGSGATLEEEIVRGQLPERDDQWVLDSYRDMLTRLAPEFRLLVQRATTSDRAPVLFHCAAGKDRTGLAAAILLGLLGVPDATIQEDYELTTVHYAPRRLDGLRTLLADHGVTEAEVRHLVEARPHAMAGTLAHIHERWGGFVGYAEAILGLGQDVVERLRGPLLNGPAADRMTPR
ncbi:MAG TPA: tyrosine-protein phosphatase [Acidimicrobiales bacterium]|nr:tyrosine-protein phosphatase [Acidimicrobiales bacterium]